MNPVSPHPDWLSLAGLIALEVTIMVGAAAALHCLTRAAAWRRTIWHVCLLGLTGLAIFELTGVARGMAGWIAIRLHAQASKAAPAHIALAEPKARASSPLPAGSANPAFSQPEERRARSDAPYLGQTLFGPDARPTLEVETSRGRAAENLPFSNDFLSQADTRIAANEPASLSESSSPEALQQAPVASVVAEALRMPGAAQDFKMRDPQPAQVENRAAGRINHGWVGAVWLLGAAAILFRVLLGRLLFIAFRRWRQTECDRPLQNRVQDLAQQVGIRRRVRLLELSRLPGPIAFGIFRPTIGLPPGFRRNFNAQQQDAMVAHELAHLAGHDPAWGILTDAIVATLWWHPLVWWARRQLCAANEAAADEASLLIANGPNVLAECLVELGNRLSRRQPFGWMSIGGNGYRSALGNRVERLLHLTRRSWRPPNRLQSGLAKTIGPAALLTAVVLCTAGTSPSVHNEGDTPMKLIDQNWKKSVLAFALAATLGTETRATLADAENTSPANKPERRMIIELDPTNQSAGDYLKKIGPSEPAQLDPRLARRYGLRADNSSAKARAVETKPSRRAVESKLEQITFDESTAFNGIPLSEVVKDLDYEARKRDPEKRGINFIISNSPEASPSAIDPATGQPTPAAQSETVDLNNVNIKLNALRHVRLRDVLDALTKVASRPIQFSVEDYGIVFSKSSGSPVSSASAEESPKMFWDEQMAKRYGLKMPGRDAAASGSASSDKAQNAVQTKLEQIIFDELPRFDGVPLGDAIRNLDAEVRKRDPEKHGINFIISNSLDAPQPSLAIDPNTGIPVPVEPMDVNAVTIRLAALRRVRLKDVLDAITKVADHPVKYTVEEYGVVLSRKATSLDFGQAQLAPAAPLQVRTYHVDTNMFLKGMESTFGIAVSDLTGKSANQGALRQFLVQLGVNMDSPGKSIFYNNLTGVLLVRANADDLVIVQAAIETLAGRGARQDDPIPGTGPGQNGFRGKAEKRYTVSVFGAVRKPGLIDLPQGQEWSVVDALAAAGDLSELADQKRIELKRHGNTTTLEFKGLLDAADASKNPKLESGDIVFVPTKKINF
ncbi:MAG: M56 family metallopeptidase [Verrucomicrobiota bacterium]